MTPKGIESLLQKFPAILHVLLPMSYDKTYSEVMADYFTRNYKEAGYQIMVVTGHHEGKQIKTSITTALDEKKYPKEIAKLARQANMTVREFNKRIKATKEISKLKASIEVTAEN